MPRPLQFVGEIAPYSFVARSAADPGKVKQAHPGDPIVGVAGAAGGTTHARETGQSVEVFGDGERFVKLGLSATADRRPGVGESLGCGPDGLAVPVAFGEAHVGARVIPGGNPDGPLHVEVAIHNAG